MQDILDEMVYFKLEVENRWTKKTILINSSAREMRKKDSVFQLNELIDQTTKSDLLAAILFAAVCHLGSSKTKLQELCLKSAQIPVLDRVIDIYKRKPKISEQDAFLTDAISNIARGYKMLPASDKIAFQDLRLFVSTYLQ